MKEKKGYWLTKETNYRLFNQNRKSRIKVTGGSKKNVAQFEG